MVILGQFRVECWVHSSLWNGVRGFQEWTEKVPQKISFVVQIVSPPLNITMILAIVSRATILEDI